MIAREELPANVDQDRRDLAELAASRRIIVERIGRQIDWLVENVGLSREEAAERARVPLPEDQLEQPPEHVPWWQLESTLEADPAQGQELWQRIKDEARHEFSVGIRAGKRRSPFGSKKTHGSESEISADVREYECPATRAA